MLHLLQNGSLARAGKVRIHSWLDIHSHLMVYRTVLGMYHYVGYDFQMILGLPYILPDGLRPPSTTVSPHITSGGCHV